MAYITVGSKFTPFTYEEKVKPFLDYAEAYDNMYKNIEQLEEEDDWAEYIKNDPQYSKIYSDYVNDLESLSSELNTSGLNSETYRKLRTLKNSYKNKLAPIKTRVDRKKMLAEEQRKLKMSNPNIHFDIDYSNLDVSNSLLDNPEASYKTLDGSIIESSTIKLGSPLAKQLRNPNDSLIVSKDNKFLLGNEKYGYSKEEMKNAVLGNSNAPSELAEVVKSIKGSYNYDNQSETFKGVIDNYIYRGLLASASEVIKPIRLNNPNYMTDAQTESIRLANELNKRKLAEADSYTDKSGNIYNWDPATEKYVLTKESEEKITQRQKALNNTPYASVMAYVAGDWNFTGNIVEEGEDDLPGGMRGRTWTSRSNIVYGNDIDLGRANQKNPYVVSNMQDLLDYFSSSKDPSDIQNNLKNNNINLPIEVIEYIQTNYVNGLFNGKTYTKPFDGRTANTMYLVKVGAKSSRGKAGGLSDYIVINEAGAKKYSNINNAINTYINDKNMHSQPATGTPSKENSDPMAVTAKGFVNDFAAAGSKDS